MRVTILPEAIILTKAHSIASEVFLIFTTQLYHFVESIFYLHYLVMSLKYSFLNTPKWQYFMLLTSGG